MTRPSGSPKYCMTRKNIQRYYTLKRLIRYMYYKMTTRYSHNCSEASRACMHHRYIIRLMAVLNLIPNLTGCGRSACVNRRCYIGHFFHEFLWKLTSVKPMKWAFLARLMFFFMFDQVILCAKITWTKALWDMFISEVVTLQSDSCKLSWNGAKKKKQQNKTEKQFQEKLPRVLELCYQHKHWGPDLSFNQCKPS